MSLDLPAQKQHMHCHACQCKPQYLGATDGNSKATLL